VIRGIILLGAPGSGKGTAAERLRDEAGYVHVSTGDMLRDAVKRVTDLGREAEGFMKRGELVPDSLIIRMVRERLQTGERNALYMFDGFPRTVVQAEKLDQTIRELGGGITHVFLLETPRDILIQRLTGRRICRQCGTNFHVVNVPPKKDGVCDACGGELYQRSDDQEATIVKRLDVYATQTESLISFYAQRGLLVRVNSNQGGGRLAADILAILRDGAAKASGLAAAH
jgi:adenylate kinase